MKIENVRIAVCDDEEMFRTYLKECIKKYLSDRKQECEIDVFSSGEELLAQQDRIAGYDIIFLDMQMKGINGIDTARKIRILQSDTFIVFVTNYLDYALEGYDVEAIRYLDKGAVKLKEALYSCMDTILKKMSFEPRYERYRFFEGELQFAHNRLLYVESTLHKVNFYVLEDRVKKYTLVGTLNRIEEELADEMYIRVHQSYLVNLAFIDRIEKYSLLLAEGTKLPIAKLRYRQVLDAWVIYRGSV